MNPKNHVFRDVTTHSLLFHMVSSNSYCMERSGWSWAEILNKVRPQKRHGWGEVPSSNRGCPMYARCFVDDLFGSLLRGTILNRAYGKRKNLPVYIYLFLLATFGPIYYGPP